MRLFLAIATTVVFASTFDLDRVAPTPLLAADRVSDLVAQARKALGGEEKFAAVKTLSFTGEFRRTMGDRQMEGTSQLIIARPDKMRRSEEISMGGMSGGPSVERISVLAGDDAWEDVQNLGGGGGGMRFEMRRGPDGPGGPGGPGGPRGPGGAGGQPPTEEQQHQFRLHRMKTEMLRWTVALLVDSPQAFVDGGVAESPEGKADILETKDEGGRSLKLFIDQTTHMPLMIQYEEQRPFMMMMGGPGGRRGPDAGPQPTREEMEQRIEERRRNPPKPSTFALHLDDYKKVDGILLPHKINTTIDGQPNEELTIEKYKLNAAVKPAEFEKPKKAQ